MRQMMATCDDVGSGRWVCTGRPRRLTGNGANGEDPGLFNTSVFGPESSLSLPSVQVPPSHLIRAYSLVGAAAAAVAAPLIWAAWDAQAQWVPIALFAGLALIAEYVPVKTATANVSLGVGFMLGACMLAGPGAGAAMVACVLALWAFTRQLLPWFRDISGSPLSLLAARAIYASSMGALVYFTATLIALSVFGLKAPIAEVSADTVAAALLLTALVYLLQNLASLGVSRVAGVGVAGRLRTIIQVPALAELLALPAALLLVVTQVREGIIAFLLLSWLYLMASYLGWRSWHDRDSLRRRLADMELLHHAGGALSGSLEMGELVRRLCVILREIVRFESMLLTLDDGGERPSAAYAFDGFGERGEVTEELLTDTQGRPDGLHYESDGSAVYTKELVVGEAARVRLRLDFAPGTPPAEQRTALLETICRQAGTALSNARMYRLANIDPLTGVAIRRYFERALRSVAAHSVPFSVIMLDLDLFKEINDVYGHRVGDLVLKDLAQVLTGTLRVLDVAARYGGEEFVILLPNASAQEAVAVAERIRRALQTRRLQIGEEQIEYRASFGVAASTDLDDATDPMETVWKADAALLAAKRAGRNRVVSFAALHS
jgi:diguanylate cyclase (GGDEF)-like protein